MDRAIARGKLLRISSEDKKDGEDNANFSVVLGNTSYVQNVRGVVLKSLSFKHVFPNVFDGNANFVFNYNGVLETATVPTGWYSAAQYASELEIQINALPAVMNAITVAIVASPATATLNQYFTFTASVGDTIGLITLPDGNPAGHLAGIDTTTGLAVSHMAENLPDFGGLSTIYLCSSELAGFNASASSNNGEQISIVTAIPIDVGYGSEVYYESKDPRLEAIIYSNLRNLNSVGLSLCTRAGNILSLQQNNLTATFKIIHASFFPAD